MPDTQTIWKLSALLGVNTALFGLFLMPMFPVTGAGYAVGYGEPVFALEFARSVPDLIAVFGGGTDLERAVRIADMVRGTIWDFGFLLIYGGFIFTFFLGVYTCTGTKFWLVFAALGIVAALGDIVENNILLGLLDDIETAKNLALLPFPVYLKFLSIMVCGIVLGVYLMLTRKAAWVVLGVLAIIGASAMLPGLAFPHIYGQYVGNAVTVFWIIQLVYAGRAGFRKTPAAL